MRTTPPGRRSRPVVSGRALVVATLLLAGCAGGPDPGGGAGADAVDGASASAAASPDLSAEVVQYRRDAQRDVVQVKVTNHTGDAVRVERVEVRSDTLTAPATADKDSTVGAGLSVDLTVPLTGAGCDGLAGAPDGPGTPTTGAPSPSAGAHVAVVVVDGAPVELAVDGTVLQQVRAQRCAEAAVGEALTATWRPQWQDAGLVDGEPALRGSLVLTPTSDVPVTVTVGGATTLFTVEEPVGVVLGAQEQVLDVVVTVARCDPHAVAEDTKGYRFPVQVAPDGGGEVVVEVAVPVPERAPLQDLIERTCY